MMKLIVVHESTEKLLANRKRYIPLLQILM